MTTLIQRVLEPVPGCASPQGGLLLAQLEDQTRRLGLGLADLSPAELMWQPGPGQNTIGMLLAHVARVEVDWIGFGILRRPMGGNEVFAITDEEIGIPLAADAQPPAALAGRTIEFYNDLLARARAFTKATVAPLTDDVLAEPFRVPWNDGELEANGSFVVSFVLAHYTLHRGQIHLLRHQYRDRAGA